MFRDQSAGEAQYSETLELDMGSVVPSLAGPKRPQDRVLLTEARDNYRLNHGNLANDEDTGAAASVSQDGQSFELQDGAVVIAAITSCTNTSNPAVMLGAGLLARNAVRAGLQVKPWVKTSLGPGSRVVTDYLERAGLMDDLEALGFHVEIGRAHV